MAERADDRLVRLLGLVAFLDGAGGVAVADLAAKFGVTERQVLADVDALWVSGTPGYWPDDLIDFDADAIDRGMVHLTQARGMTRPLRLAPREASALIAALRAVADTVAVRADPQLAAVVDSVLQKVATAAGGAAVAVDVQLASSNRVVTPVVAEALRQQRRLHLHYVTGADVQTVRDVDPIRVYSGDDHEYLVGWCYLAGDYRTFRLDRIISAETLSEAVGAHPSAPPADFVPAEDAPLVTLRLAPSARLVAEMSPVVAIREKDHGEFEVDLRVHNRWWFRRLLLVWADHIRGVWPLEFADDVAAHAEETLAAYAVVP